MTDEERYEYYQQQERYRWKCEAFRLELLKYLSNYARHKIQERTPALRMDKTMLEIEKRNREPYVTAQQIK